MQEDMHYYGTYAMARAAGLAVKHAKVIAYAAQYVDDSTANDSDVHDDGGMFQTIATAHTNSEAIGNAIADQTEQRNVWVPFHFFPGNKVGKLSKKLTCVEDSDLVQEMVANHIRHALSSETNYSLALMGIVAHVYADTFSHYGFSGVSSTKNKVDGTSFVLHVKNTGARAYIMGKFSSFLTKYTPNFIIENYRNIVSYGASVATGALGHGAVGTYPDRPFLKWEFAFKDPKKKSGLRKNPVTFLKACEKLHQTFQKYGEGAGICNNTRPFNSIKDKVAVILQNEFPKDKRIEEWLKAIRSGDLFTTEDHEADNLYYTKHEWEQQKDDFEDLEDSSDIIKSEVYKFHQAALYHRDYTLKQLLPKHGILVV